MDEPAWGWGRVLTGRPRRDDLAQAVPAPPADPAVSAVSAASADPAGSEISAGHTDPTAPGLPADLAVPADPRVLEPGRSRLLGIEGLRGLAACSILVYHVGLYSQPPQSAASFGPVSRYVFPHLPLGVTLFFTLSAFLLYRPIAAAVVDRRPRPKTRAYLLNRALRILPAYWVVLAVTAVVLPAAVLRTGIRTIELGRMTDDPGLLARNAVLVQNYAPQSLLTGIAPAWSLAVEAVFYLVVPVLGLLAVACARPCRTAGGRLVAATAPAGVLLLVGLSGKAAAERWVVSAGSPSAGWDGDWHSVVVRSFWGQADLFTLGIALAVLWVGLDRDLVTLPRWWRWVAWTALPLVVVVLVVAADRGIWSPGRNPYELAGSVACTLVLALVVLPTVADGRPGLPARLLSRRLVAVIGLWSYSIFLWHEPLVRLLRSRGLTFPGRPGWVLNLVLVAALTAALSAASYRWVERPALRRRAVPGGDGPVGKRGSAGQGGARPA